MNRSERQGTVAIMSALFALGFGATAAQAQVAQSRTAGSIPGIGTTPFSSSPIWNLPGATPVNPGASAVFNPALASPTNPLAAAYNGALLSGQVNPYANSTGAYGGNGLTNGYGGYGTYYESDIGAFLRGTAETVNSQGKWMVSLQQASLLKEQVRQAALETRRKQLEQYFAERQQTPTFGQVRESSNNQQLFRSLNNPPESEILSGQALNDILADISKADEPAARGPAATMDKEMLRHINLTSGRGTASAALLKNDGRLTWPSALLDEITKADRELIDSLARTAMYQTQNGGLEPSALGQLAVSSRRLRQKLTADVGQLSARQYIDATRFIAQLDDAIRVLGRPDARDYLSRAGAEGKDVAELVRNMTGKGLRFAAATPGDEPAYLALHRALVVYDGAGSRVAAR
jgi:hypothetical protein